MPSLPSLTKEYDRLNQYPDATARDPLRYTNDAWFNHTPKKPSLRQSEFWRISNMVIERCIECHRAILLANMHSPNSMMLGMD
ncbi:hypothetical protein KIN20_028450 [Parelaphostrongylus tenuis]|uniref:Uncharacterized protein n=1 Tax=Parelaphostrongylus tenuis TaxID=148309 RepID=A0AAD5WEQ4_PARTN|nr:hypothetical protein KIN20_028450 [Parelaphostrongylus tenuis]